MTATDITHAPPPAFDTPDAATLKRWLDRAAARYGELLRTLEHVPSREGPRWTT